MIPMDFYFILLIQKLNRKGTATVKDKEIPPRMNTVFCITVYSYEDGALERTTF